MSQITKSARNCFMCQHLDRFVNTCFDEPFLCCHGSTKELSLAGCRTIRISEMLRTKKQGCPKFAEKVGAQQ